MTKSELIEQLATKLPHLLRGDVELAINSLIHSMTHNLATGGRIEIRGFGGFSITRRAARMGHNPKTGERVSLPSRYATHFKPGLDLRERVNHSREIYPNIKDL
ncbi:Integration host factor beta subunit [Methylomonas albis]|uniref:Integration host factor subunit beta n=1 Tax=Methylomonas albis TaxID=1854563 RepID=A0ABR9D623_9GAMM|nr:integration host factor subunit beta [Methylomonas albis]MBD9357322.1 integration host factor subunit beta [Methylomonas albis]CAD6880569.1 Integration host factor beta subunit [Methylomonas albis]